MAKSKSSKIAVILYSVNRYADDLSQAAKTLQRLRKIGYENVQVSGGSWRALPAEDMKKIADDAGINIIGAHIPLEPFRDDASQVAEMMLSWEAEYVAIPSFRPAEGEAPAAAWKKFAKECNRHGKVLKKHGITLQYHNHAFEFEKFGMRAGRGGRTAHEILFKESNPDYLQAELDLGWVARAGVNPAEYVKQFKGRTDQVHAKDWGMQGNDPIWRAVGEGNLNWPSITRACKASGVKMYIVELDSCPVTNDPFRSLALSYEHLMEMSL